MAERKPLPFVGVPVIDLRRSWSADAFRAWCRLLHYAWDLRTRPDRGGTGYVEADRRAFCWLMGRPRADYALRVFGELHEHRAVLLRDPGGDWLGTYEALARSQLGASTVLAVPNYAEILRFARTEQNRDSAEPNANAKPAALGQPRVAPRPDEKAEDWHRRLRLVRPRPEAFEGEEGS